VRVSVPARDVAAAVRHAAALRTRIDAELAHHGSVDPSSSPSNCSASVFDGPRDASCLAGAGDRWAVLRWRWSDGGVRLRVIASGTISPPSPEVSMEWHSDRAPRR
jgi:hypothetical protein